MKDHILCTIYDCEFDSYFEGIIFSNIVYVIKNDGSYVPPKESICEYVDYGLVQYYTGSNCNNKSDSQKDKQTKDDNSRWGYFDLQTGIIIIPAVYEYVGPFYGDRALVKKNGKFGFSDYNGKIVVDIIWDEIYCGKDLSIWNGEIYIPKSDPWVVRKDDKWGYINREGEVIIPLDFDYASLFNENRARIKKEGKWGYINGSGELIIEPLFDEINEFKCIGKDCNISYYAARVIKNGKYGFIDTDGKYIIKPMFEEAFEFWDIGYACVKVCAKWGIIDKMGRFVVTSGFDDIGEYYGKTGKCKSYAQRRWGRKIDGYHQQTLGESHIKDVYFTVKLDDKWGIMDSDFNVIMPDVNNHFVEFNGMKIYIKNGKVTSSKKIKVQSLELNKYH